MKHIKAFGFALILFIIFVWIVLFIITKIIIPVKLDIGQSLVTPNVVELDLSEAKKLLRNKGFVIQDSLVIDWVKTPKFPDRTVISQFPAAGKIVKNKNRVKLEVSSGGQLVVIPLILEENAINASSKLKQIGLEVSYVKKKYGLYAENTVVKVDPEVGSKVLKGSLITLYIESEVEDINVESDTLDSVIEDSEDYENGQENDIETLEDILQNN